MGVALAFRHPAFGGLGFDGGDQHEAAAVRDGFVHIQLAFHQRAQRGDHLENGAGGAACVNVVVHQHVARIGQNGGALGAALNHGV